MNNTDNDIEVIGFDSEGEPSIGLQDDGSIHIMFNFMPPSYAHETIYARNFEDFEEQLTAAVDSKVNWEDRELFIIEKPNTDTQQKLIEFLSTYEAQESYKNIERKLLGHAAFRLIHTELEDTVFKKLLQSGFHERLPRDGVSRTYRKEINGCEQKFYFTYDSRYREYACSLEMRVEAVEKIYYQFKGFFMSGMTEQNTCTLRPNLEHFLPSVKPSSYPQSIRAVDSTLADVRALVLDFGIPFFKQNNNLKNVEETLNGNLDLPIDARKNFMNGQAIRGAILATLAGGARLEEVRTYYEKDMPNWSEAAIENWNQLLEHLEKGC
ncbi:hypothetical protein [Undibacterium danionis]|uniref:DUF3800 domain-containing protein n=1 Tax=Undibacterium danionis TaxID=1812100 RepID=A0ABV6IK08_9BURK